MKNNPLHYILDVITILMIIVDRGAYIVDRIRALIERGGNNGGNK